MARAADGNATAAPPVVLTINPGAYIWYAHPLDGGAHRLEVFYAYVTLDVSQRWLGFHLEPRFRDTKLRDYYTSNVWVQEAYAYARLGRNVMLKVGKLYNRFGVFWDGTFANLQFFDGLKLSPDHGFSAEGSVPLRADEPDQSLTWAVQYFVVDGVTNGSLPGRDPISIPGARRRDVFVARVAPRFALSRAVEGSLGWSLERYRADFAEVADDTVTRVALDASLTMFRRLRLLGEYTWQHGRNVSAQMDSPRPLPAAADFESNRVEYGLATAEVTWRALTVRAAVSVAHYSQLLARETFLHPGLAYTIDPRITLVGEWIRWTRSVPEGTRTVSNGLHIILFVRY